MARGWESKSVEAQQAPDGIDDRGPALSGEAAARERKRASLSMSRRRVLRELDSATTEAHRAALRNALGYLDAELAPLGGPSD